MKANDSETKQAAVHLRGGLGIGYSTVLAEVTEDVDLANGTHFLLARNGRGKTTLLKTLSGLLKGKRGDFEMCGHCQFVGDDLNFDRELTPQRIFNALLSPERRESALSLGEKLELDVKKPFGKLSFGNRKKVGLVVAEHRFAADAPNIVLYDEPFTGLDTPAREVIHDLWRSTERDVLRIVSCHPDFDAMEMPQALLITDEKIFRGGDGTRSWADFKNLLN